MLAVEEIGGDDLVIVVGGVRERTPAVHLAQCPNAFDIGAQLLVHGDVLSARAVA